MTVPCVISPAITTIPPISPKTSAMAAIRATERSSACRVDLAVGGDDGDRSDQDQRRRSRARTRGRCARSGPSATPSEGGAHRISSPPVSSRNASSREVASATSSCKTMAFAAASSPTRSGGAGVTSWSPSRLPSKPACTSASRQSGRLRRAHPSAARCPRRELADRAVRESACRGG